MPTAGDASLPADITGVVKVVLDDDALDILELVLTGAAATIPTVIGGPAGVPVLLIDRDGTPLAQTLPTPGSKTGIRVHRAMSRGHGPVWDPALRRAAPEFRTDVLRGEDPDHVLAVVIDDLPTRADVRSILSVTARRGISVVIITIPVARSPRPAGEVGWAGRVRAGRSVAEMMATARPDLRVVPLIVPWPDRPDGYPADLDLATIMQAYGATSTLRLRDVRPVEESEPIRSISQVLERSVDDIYPSASAVEILSVLRGQPDQGTVILLTGLSGSGKSTIARALVDDLRDSGPSRVTLLDGDEVRRNLSADLDFSAASRESNLDRIAYVASLIAEHGGIVIAAAIAPFAESRARARSLIEAHGRFLLVYVDTPLEVCEARDRKGLYALARAGALDLFTGISSPYEVPDDADVVVDTTRTEPTDAVRAIREALRRS